MKVRGLGDSRRWNVVATTYAPAVCASRSNSASEDSVGHWLVMTFDSLPTRLVPHSLEGSFSHEALPKQMDSP